MTDPLLVLAPHGRDATVIARVLETAGVPVEIHPDLGGIHGNVDRAGGVVLTEETLAGDRLPPLLDWVASQPPWSDLPFLVLVARRAATRVGRRARIIEALGNPVLLERPLNAESLASAARSAIRARRRQRAMRDLADTLESRVHDRTRALAETEARFRTVFEGFPESLFVVRVHPDGAMRYESRNPAAARRSGIPDDAIIGRAPDEVAGHPHAAELIEDFRRCIDARRNVDVTREMRFPAGTATFDVTLTPMLDEDGRVARILGVARDVTERNRLEARLRQAQKLEAIGQLTGGVAHDFNNLLQVVLSGLTLMERVRDPARLATLADSVRRAAQRGGELTKRLLTVARRQSLQPEPIDLPSWLRDGAGELLARALRGDIAVEHRFAPDLPHVDADPSELELAILNLAVNARDAMSDGGTITIAAEALVLDGSPAFDGLTGNFVRLSIQDTGTGMDAATQARVFEPFFTTKEVGKGTGLGLAQVYGFAKQSGGSVRLRTAPGQGTTVSLFLPVTSRAPSPHAHPPARRARPRPGRRHHPRRRGRRGRCRPRRRHAHPARPLPHPRHHRRRRPRRPRRRPPPRPPLHRRPHARRNERPRPRPRGPPPPPRPPRPPHHRLHRRRHHRSPPRNPHAEKTLPPGRTSHRPNQSPPPPNPVGWISEAPSTTKSPPPNHPPPSTHPPKKTLKPPSTPHPPATPPPS